MIEKSWRLFLSKTINFNKDETEPKMENPAYNFQRDETCTSAQGRTVKIQKKGQNLE